MDRRAHWDHVYETKPLDTVSWYQRYPQRSVQQVQKYARPSQSVLDVGAGASYLIDALLGAGYANLIALDVSPTALERVKSRLGARATEVRWVVGDVSGSPELPTVDLWHDRATLHFLTTRHEQVAYAKLAAKTVKAGGHLAIAAFAPDGPERCSGLDVQRHSGASLSKLFGTDFELLEENRDSHSTPAGAEQIFCWTVFRRRDG